MTAATQVLALKDSAEEAPSPFPSVLATDALAATAFLTSIADVEMFGAKWIVALPHRYWNEELHGHALDELRHAKLVQSVSRELRYRLSDADLLREAKLARAIQEATERYLSGLSLRAFRPVRKKLGEDWYEPAYVLLSFLIERRLMKIYPHYARQGATEEMRRMARSLISDERKHLSFVNEKLPARLELAGAEREELIALEERLALEWLETASHAAQAV